MQSKMLMILNCLLLSHSNTSLDGIKGSHNKTDHISLVTKCEASVNLKKKRKSGNYKGWVHFFFFVCLGHFSFVPLIMVAVVLSTPCCADARYCTFCITHFYTASTLVVTTCLLTFLPLTMLETRTHTQELICAFCKPTNFWIFNAGRVMVYIHIVVNFPIRNPSVKLYHIRINLQSFYNKSRANLFGGSP